MIEKRNAAHKKDAKTVRDRNTAADIAEAGAWAHPGHDDDEEGKSEEGEPEHEEEDGEGGGGKNKIAKTEIDTQFLLTHSLTHTHRVAMNLKKCRGYCK